MVSEEVYKQSILENIPFVLYDVDFKDLANKEYIIKYSFQASYKKMEKEPSISDWYYVIEPYAMNANLIALINMKVEDGFLNVYFYETNKIFQNQKKSHKVFKHLGQFVKHKQLKGIKVENNEFADFFQKLGFVKNGDYLILES